MLRFTLAKHQCLIKEKSVKKTNLVAVALMAMTTVSPVLFAAEQAMSAEQKKQVEQVVHDYLVQNPEVLVNWLR